MATVQAQEPKFDLKEWTKKLSRSGYFFAALLLHLIAFLMLATWIIFPAFIPPVEDFTKTYLPPPAPPPPPPTTTQTQAVPTHTIAPPTPVIATTAPSLNFSIPIPDFTQHATTPDQVTKQLTSKPVTTKNNLSARLGSIMATETESWGRSSDNIRNSHNDPHAVVAKFPVYLAAYANGDWSCNVGLDKDTGNIVNGSLPNFVAKVVEWSKGNLKAQVIPTPLNIGGPELLGKKPPFIFFTGHKDFVLTDTEIQNLRDYLQVGGAIWGDNTLAGRGSRFDVAFRREMKRVIPDADKNFEPVPLTHEIFTKSWYNLTQVPDGMNFYKEPVEHIDIDGKLAIIYTPNDYSDLMTLCILPGDTRMAAKWPTPESPILCTNGTFENNAGVFFRNYTLEGALAADQFAMNILGFMLVRFDNDLLLTP